MQNNLLSKFLGDFISFPSLTILGIGVLFCLLIPNKKFIAITVFLATLAEVFSFREAYISSVFSENLFSSAILNTYTTRFLSALFLFISFLVLTSDYDEEISEHHEYGILYLVSLMGGVVLLKSQELLTFFVGLECLSLPLYCMCGSALMKRQSSESALKYFMLGAVSSAFFLFGVSLLFGATGSTKLPEIYDFLQRESSMLGSVGAALIIFSVLFKAGAAPFHFWVSDVYTGAPKSTTTFMASAVKVVTLGVCARICGEMFIGDDTTKILWAASLLSIIFGNLLAIQARSLVSLFAASSIAHVGYILISLLGGLAPSQYLFYLTGYALASLGCFSIIAKLSEQKIKGLYSHSPSTAVFLAFFILSFAGLPPVLSGLYGKFLVFSQGISSGFTGLVIVALIASAISLVYYLRLIIEIFFHEGDAKCRPQFVVHVSAIVLLMMTVFPDLFLNFFGKF